MASIRWLFYQMRGKIKERAPNQVQESLRAEVRNHVVNNSARLKGFENVISGTIFA